jgi:WD40 repeat protein
LSFNGDDAGAGMSDGPLNATIEPPSLGDFAQPCGVIGNSQPMLSSFSPTGDLVALAVGPGHVELHATSDGHTVGSFDAHLGPVTALAYSPKEALLATGGLDGVVKLWRDGTLLSQVKVFTRAVGDLIWSHDGSSLAATTPDGPIALLSVLGNTLNLRWRDDRQYRSFAFTPNDSVVIAFYVNEPTAGFHSGSRSFRASDGSEVESGIYYSVYAQSPDGSIIAFMTSSTASLSMPITFARLTSDGETFTLKVLWERGFQTSAPQIAFTGDSKQVAMWGGYGDTNPAKLYDVENGNLVTTLAWADDTIGGLTFSGDGRFALVLDSEAGGGAARLVDLTSGSSSSIATQPARSQSLGDLVEVSADSALMASPLHLSADSNDISIAVWDLAKLQMVRQIPWANASRADLSAKGDLLWGLEYSAQPGTNTVYDCDGLRIESLTDPTSIEFLLDPIFCNGGVVALASDGRTLAAAGFVDGSAGKVDRRIRIFDRILGAFTGDFSIGDRWPRDLRFSPDGTSLLVSPTEGWTVGADAPTKGISLWRVRDGQLLWEGSARTSRSQDAAFSPDGSTLVLVGNGLSNTLDSPGVDVYDAHSGTWLRTLATTYTSRASVRFSPDGQYLMVPTYSSGIEIWRTSDWQRYNAFGYAVGNDAVFLPQNKGVLEISTGVVWCAH